MLELLGDWDRETFIYLNNLDLGGYDAFWIFVTQIKHWVPLYIFFLALFVIGHRLKKGILGALFTILTFLFTLGLTQLVKTHIARLRPNNEPKLKDLIRVLQEPNNFSFFSGHAAVSFAVTTFVVLALRNTYRWVYVFYLWPLLFIFSRIFVGVHYPSDIIVGAGVGTLMAFLFFRLYGLALGRYGFKSDYQ